MKIVYCIPSLSNSGGTERILTEKVNYLANHQNQYDIYIITTEGAGMKPFYALDPKIKIVEFKIDFNDIYDFSIIKKYFYTKQKLKLYRTKIEDFIRENKIDICISTGAKELEFLYELNKYCKTICELHFSKNIRKDFILARKIGFFWKIIGEIRTIQLIKQTKRINKLIVLTKADKEQWLLTNKNVCQIYNFSSFTTNKIPELTSKTAIAVGRLEPQKGFDLLIDAWKIVAARHRDWILNIYGDGDLKQFLIQKIKDNDLQDNVFLKGKSNQIQKNIFESCFFILSSRYEGFPMVLLESLSLGVPIVSFDCKTGPNEIIHNNDCGILVENGNISKLSEAILKMIEDKELRLSKGIEAKEISEAFSKEKIMEQWINLFNNI